MKRLVILILLLLLLGTLSLIRANSNIIQTEGGECKSEKDPTPRPHSVTITEFGAIGDGKTLNTLAFQNAIFYLRSFADKGGAQLYVPKGDWLTGSFNLTSHLTLFLERGAVIIATKESSQWPIVEPLPSYGQGLDLPGSRHISLINGYNLTDVVITGNNGVIDGQGSVWWDWFKSNELNYSRPHLVEFVDSKEIVISNLTFLNSPAWGIHTVYCSNVQVQNITIETSPDSPFTNGIVPDSTSNMCIKNCAITVGYDAISLKSGWDNYGIIYARPTNKVHISSVSLSSPNGSSLSIGSEMSGGISQIQIDQIKIFNSFLGISLKTGPGRGGFIENITISGVEMQNVQTAIEITGNCNTHPSDQYDLSNLPLVDHITLKNIVGSNISIAGLLYGIESDPFKGICLSNVTLSAYSYWNCSNISGYSESVIPEPCSDLKNPYLNSSICFTLDANNNNSKYIPLAVE